MLLLGITFYSIFLSLWQLMLNTAVTHILVSPCIIPHLQPEKLPSSFNTKMLSPLKLRARCHSTPAKPSSTEQWHHAGKIQILLILLRGRQSCAPSTQHALHHSGQYLALLSSNRFAEQVLAKALLSAKLEEGSTTSGETALSSCCSVGLLLPVHSGWTSSAQKGGEHNCIFVVTRVGCKKENLGTAWVTQMLSGICLGFQGNFFSHITHKMRSHS